MDPVKLILSFIACVVVFIILAVSLFSSPAATPISALVGLVAYMAYVQSTKS